mmetsp:Transcript_21683/g.45612  ORF Transcript_21683/g.45612 Transcript_21683/m.45612 type:complete len:299 (+) Transcript_21683:1062-1958(+)
MIRQKLHPKHSGVLIQPVNLHPILIVNKHLPLLRQRHHTPIVQETRIPDGFLHIKLRLQRQGVLIHHGHVTLPPPPRQQGKLARPIVRQLIRPVARIQLQIVNIPGIHLLQKLPLQFLLRQLHRLLHVVLCLHQAGGVHVEDFLRVRRGDGVFESLGLLAGHLPFERFVGFGVSFSKRESPVGSLFGILRRRAVAIVARRVGRRGAQFVVLLQVLETGVRQVGPRAVEVPRDVVASLRRGGSEGSAEGGALLEELGVGLAAGHIVGASVGVLDGFGGLFGLVRGFFVGGCRVLFGHGC